MRHLNALCPHIQQAQHQLRIIIRDSHDRRDAGQFGDTDHLAHQLQVEYGMLHVNKRPVEPGHSNDLYNCRVSEANMADNRQAALAHDALDSILMHLCSPPSTACYGPHHRIVCSTATVTVCP
jgi:hypothetical protein